MKRFQFSTRNQSDDVRYGLRQTWNPFVQRRLAYSLAGAFLVASVVALANAVPSAQRTDKSSTQDSAAETPHRAADTTSADNQPKSVPSTTTHTSFSSSTTNGSTTSSLQVNGQDIAMTPGSDTQQTIVDDSGTTTVKASSDESGSNVSVHVDSHSESQGGT